MATSAPLTSPHAAGDGGQLTERDRHILMFERQWWRYEGSKEEAIRSLFGLDITRYYQILSTLIDLDTALEYDPQLVRRLRRMRDDRARNRSARRLDPGHPQA
ncbi:MAG: DUF3263 domain-containing protein [Bifidobacteriaceae bacterium]|jgi:hypothetical protein|nr:DUF3263 domain-containing protein [Bifidobacteriaceae bacterium]